MKLRPEDIVGNDDFELLAEVEHSKIKEFVMDQVMNEKNLVKTYGIYQIAMMALLLFVLAKSIIQLTRGISEPILAIGASILFSVTLLVIIHELIHAVAYWLTGSKNLSVGAIWRKFIFYVAADRQVIDFPSFRIVALAPFITVKLATIILTIAFWSSPLAYFYLSIMCLHSLFCGGDIAMLAFYYIHHDKEIYNFDDLKTGRTFFYIRKEQ